MNTLMVDIVKRQFCKERIQSWWEDFGVQLHFGLDNEDFALEIESEDGPTVALFIITFDTGRSEYLGTLVTALSQNGYSPV